MLPDAKVVKAFNTISAYIMINAPREEGVPDLFIAGNDKEAKVFVNDIAMQWGWGSVIDLGDIGQSFFLKLLPICGLFMVSRTIIGRCIQAIEEVN